MAEIWRTAGPGTHSVKLIPSTRAKERQPQKLLDFRAGACTAITEQIRFFRDQGLVGAASCPVTGESLGRHNVAVDYLAPTTFDQLLFSFCQRNQINPLGVVVGSRDGVVAFLEDSNLRVAWEGYHLKYAQLRIISKTGNLKLPKPSIPWMELYGPCEGHFLVLGPRVSTEVADSHGRQNAVITPRFKSLQGQF